MLSIDGSGASQISNEKDFYNYLALAFGFFARLWVLHQKKMIDDYTWNTWDEWFEIQWFPIHVFDTFWKNEGPFFMRPFYDYVNEKYLNYKTNQASGKKE